MILITTKSHISRLKIIPLLNSKSAVLSNFFFGCPPFFPCNFTFVDPSHISTPLSRRCIEELDGLSCNSHNTHPSQFKSKLNHVLSTRIVTLSTTEKRKKRTHVLPSLHTQNFHSRSSGDSPGRVSQLSSSCFSTSCQEYSSLTYKQEAQEEKNLLSYAVRTEKSSSQRQNIPNILLNSQIKTTFDFGIEWPIYNFYIGNNSPSSDASIEYYSITTSTDIFEINNNIDRRQFHNNALTQNLVKFLQG